MKQDDEHTIKDIVENMASKLYFHGTLSTAKKRSRTCDLR